MLIDLINNTYLKLINQWTKDLYTPKLLLDDIINKIIKSNWHKGPHCFTFNYQDIINLINDQYKFYKEFYYVLSLHKNYFLNTFHIYVCTLNIQNKNDYLELEKQINNPLINGNTLFEITKQNNFPKAATNTIPSNNSMKIATGCIILIDNRKNDLLNKEQLETILDHELNHFFSLINDDVQNLEQIKVLDSFIKTAIDAGYNVKSKDFIDHLFNKNQFISMCSDVCNNIDFKLKKIFPTYSNSQIFYKWLDWSTNDFITSLKYQQLDEQLQKILLFSYACRKLSKQRWHKLKHNVQIQLDNPSKNLFKSVSNWLKMLFE